MHAPSPDEEPQASSPPDAEAAALPQPSPDGQLLAGPEQPSETQGPRGEDRRVSPRRKKLLRIFIQEGGDESPPFIGWVVDRSLGGLRLEIDHEIPAGTVLKIRSTVAPEGIPGVDVRVHTARHTEEGGWHMGCSYVRIPNWEVRIQFD